jgi:DNA-binding LacI/PurR family transcriptional regulator
MSSIKKVTLHDIATDTGFSVSTVSRALSRAGKISKDKEKKIFESAYRLKYPMPVESTPIELRSSINIALITKHYTGEFFSSLFDGFDQSVTSDRVRINLLSVSYANDAAEKLACYLEKSPYDAAIVFLPDYKASDYIALMNSLPQDFPLVSIAPIASPVLDTITFDNYRGGYLAAQHLEECGYRKVGIVQGSSAKSEAMLRKNGFIDYIQVSDSMELVWEYNGDYSFYQGQLAYESYKNSEIRPEAIFCSNDGMTIGFVHSAIRDGLSIPKELAVIGFDDLPICDLYTPTITSVHTPYNLLGKKTLEILMGKLQNRSSAGNSGYTSLVPVSLSVRESSMALSEVYPNHYKSLKG